MRQQRLDAEAARSLRAAIYCFLCAAGLLALLLALNGCAGWQAKSATVLDKISSAAALASPSMETICDQVERDCKANPCAELLTCHKVERDVATVALSAQLLALQGFDALEVADKPKLERLLPELTKLYGRLREALGAYGVNLP